MQDTPRIVVIGSLNMDLVTETARFPQKGETILGHKFSFSHGGKGANQAVGLGRLEAQVSMIGAVGQDAFGNDLLKNLQENNVDISAVKKVAGISTGVASITLTKEDNNIIVVPGANSYCSPQQIVEYEDLIKKAQLVLLQMEIPLETVSQGIEMAKKYGKKVILNPAPAQKIPKEILNLIDYITPNLTELAVLSGLYITNQKDLVKAMQILLEKGVKNVITTLGSKGVAYMSQDKILHNIPAQKVTVVDTIGAGDAFNAALAYSLALFNSLEESITLANKAAALAVTRLGAQASMPYLNELVE